MSEHSWDHLKNVRHRGWQLCLEAFYPNYQRKLLESLRDAYLEATRDVIHFIQDAEGMHYPQFRARLLRIAAEGEHTVQPRWRARSSVAQLAERGPRGAKRS
jgi:hypothetical protein